MGHGWVWDCAVLSMGLYWVVERCWPWSSAGHVVLVTEMGWAGHVAGLDARLGIGLGMGLAWVLGCAALGMGLGCARNLISFTGHGPSLGFRLGCTGLVWS
jgi:hypothetical protein